MQLCDKYLSVFSFVNALTLCFLRLDAEINNVVSEMQKTETKNSKNKYANRSAFL